MMLQFCTDAQERKTALLEITWQNGLGNVYGKEKFSVWEDGVDHS